MWLQNSPTQHSAFAAEITQESLYLYLNKYFLMMLKYHKPKGMNIPYLTNSHFTHKTQYLCFASAFFHPLISSTRTFPIITVTKLYNILFIFITDATPLLRVGYAVATRLLHICYALSTILLHYSTILFMHSRTLFESR